MSGFLLESPWRLAVVAIAVQFTLICIWSLRRTRIAGQAVWIGFVAWPILLTVNGIVQTTRERVMQWCREMALAVERGDVPEIMSRIDESFAVEQLDRAGFEDRVTSTLERYRIDRPKLRRFQIDFPDNDRAVVEFEATCRVRSAKFFDTLVSRWRLQLRRRDESWLAVSIEAVPTPLSPIRDVRDWLR